MSLHCPKCGSSNIHTEKKGYNVTKGVIGATLFGKWGLLAGTQGQNELVCTCLDCNNTFSVEEGQNALSKEQRISGHVCPSAVINIYGSPQVKPMQTKDKGELDPRIKEMAVWLVTNQKALIDLKKQYELDYLYWGKICDQLEFLGVVSHLDDNFLRKILVRDMTTLQALFDKAGI